MQTQTERGRPGEGGGRGRGCTCEPARAEGGRSLQALGGGDQGEVLQSLRRDEPR